MTLLLRTCVLAFATTIALGLGPTAVKTANAQMHRSVNENQRTYLVNGLASVMPFVGYGFKNLKSKLKNAKNYDYATPVEGRIAIQPMVLSDIKKQYQKDPSVLINLVGISYGANIVTSLAAQLNNAGIPVNYLGVLDGPMLTRVTPNVHRVDNFICRQMGCIGQHIRLARGNKTTISAEFKLPSAHIALADHEKVHARIIGQLTSYPMLIAGRPIDTMTTGSIQ